MGHEQLTERTEDHYCVFMKFCSRIRCRLIFLSLTFSAFPPGASSSCTFGSNTVHNHSGYSSSGNACTLACPFCHARPSSTVPSTQLDLTPE